jgi:hypothetical protein
VCGFWTPQKMFFFQGFSCWCDKKPFWKIVRKNCKKIAEKIAQQLRKITENLKNCRKTANHNSPDV